MPSSRGTFDRRIGRALGTARLVRLPGRADGPLGWLALAREALGESGAGARRASRNGASDLGQLLGRLARAPRSPGLAPLRRLLAASVARAVRETLAEAKRRGLAVPKPE